MNDRIKAIQEAKQHMRLELKILRAQLSKAQKWSFDQSIAEQMIKVVEQRQCRVIHSYLPIAEEVDITSCLRHFLKFGLLVICARALRNGLLEHRRLHNLNHVKKGLFGTNYPVEKDIYAGPYDLIIVPGLAFDQANNRLGYGGGYYDAFLSLHPEAYKVGVGYDFQRVPTVPVEEHDQHLDLVITNLFVK